MCTGYFVIFSCAQPHTGFWRTVPCQPRPDDGSYNCQMYVLPGADNYISRRLCAACYAVLLNNLQYAHDQAWDTYMKAWEDAGARNYPIVWRSLEAFQSRLKYWFSLGRFLLENTMWMGDMDFMPETETVISEYVEFERKVRAQIRDLVGRDYVFTDEQIRQFEEIVRQHADTAPLGLENFNIEITDEMLRSIDPSELVLQQYNPAAQQNSAAQY